jgi:FKBP-type peptidyl-prolyl cis-trans isomerase
MGKSLAPGVTLLAETEGDGRPAAKGDRVVYNTKIWLNRGDEVRLNAMQVQHLPEQMIREVAGEMLIDHSTVLGTRRVIAGVERSLTGMKSGGYRKVRVSPHLAYRDKGVPGLIPANAVLVIEIWLRGVTSAQDT